jgi:HK97 family phage portal protein
VITRWVRGLTTERRMAPTAPALDWLLGSRSAAGVTVTPTASLASTTVMACVNLIARSLASVPLVLYRRTPQGAAPAQDHPLHALLADMANPLQTAMEVRETLLANVLLYGNGYAEIEWGPDGYPAALWPMDAERVGLEISKERQLTYSYYSEDFGLVKLPGWRVLHLRGLATSGLLGISPIRAAMNAVGLALATETFGARYFAEGAAPSLVLSYPSRLTPEATASLRKVFETQWNGLSNTHRLAIIGDGVKPEAFQIRADEAQFLETRAFQVAEICRIFNVVPGLVGAAETQTYASAEQDMIRFRELTLGPWAEALEKRIAADCLTVQERPRLFAQHKLAKLQATDLRTRYETYNVAKQAGILTTNEIRRMEDYNPVPGGDELWMPLNMAPASVVAAQTQEKSTHE